MFYRLVLFTCFGVLRSCNSQSELFEGAPCEVDGVEGACVNIMNCMAALRGLRKGKMPKTCSFSGSDPIVCCVTEHAAAPATTTHMQWGTIATPTTPHHTTTPPPTTTYRTESKFGGMDMMPVPEPSEEQEDCPPIPPNQTAPKTGQKAWDKCVEYQALVLPCEGGRRLDACPGALTTWIIDGSDANDGEFPHMALVGFGSEPAQLEFQCGGALVSERFVLTAGHCASTRTLGPVSYVLLGALRRSRWGPEQLHRVRAVHKHPQYAPPRKYHDIALLELDTPLNLTAALLPACLDVGNKMERAIATGWGATAFRGANSDTLQKVELTQFSEMECAAYFVPTRNLQRGFDSDSQLCFGDRTRRSDTCQGDSGGPLQVQLARLYCMQAVVGVTSFGNQCGVPGQPALYTRVERYLPWIEALVWPAQ